MPSATISLPEALGRAAAAQQTGQFIEAERLCRAILGAEPDHFHAVHLLATVQHRRGRRVAALETYDKALALRPDSSEALNNRGLALNELKRFVEALASYDAALAIRPDDAEVLNNRGNTLDEMERLEEALASYDRAIAIQPHYVIALNNRGNILQKLKRLDEAMASYDKALELQPDYVAALTHRGHVLKNLTRLAEAVASYETALAMQPDCAEALYGRSLCLLMSGNLDRGWREYEARWLVYPAYPFPQPLWLGDADIKDRTILIHCEQGIGDTIQFCRYAKLVARRGARVVLAVQREIATLLASLDPALRVIALDSPIPEFDVHIPLLSLPLAFKTTLDTTPAETVYLHAPVEKLALWRDRLGTRTKPRIGLVWAGSPRLTESRGGKETDRVRSIAFDQLAPLLGATDCEFYSLQKGADAVAQLRQSPWRGQIVDWTDELHDFADTAALVDCLDLVITVDTSVAHLAGALGKPFWLMNRFNTCWRWLLDRDDSPWYPTARIFRQPRYGDWAAVIESVAAALRPWSAADTADRQAPMRAALPLPRQVG